MLKITIQEEILLGSDAGASGNARRCLRAKRAFLGIKMGEKPRKIMIYRVSLGEKQPK